MKIALINGSPKASGSLSGQILQDLRERLLAHSRQTDGSACDTDISIYQCNKPQINQQDLAQIAACDAWSLPFRCMLTAYHRICCDAYLKWRNT